MKPLPHAVFAFPFIEGDYPQLFAAVVPGFAVSADVVTFRRGTLDAASLPAS